jgi:hypothetical protein
MDTVHQRAQPKPILAIAIVTITTVKSRVANFHLLLRRRCLLCRLWFGDLLSHQYLTPAPQTTKGKPQHTAPLRRWLCCLI